MSEAYGWSTCPVCGTHWRVTAERDCLLPYCGCYGTDASAANPSRLCQPCGLAHVGMDKCRLVTIDLREGLRLDE